MGDFRSFDEHKALSKSVRIPRIFQSRALDFEESAVGACKAIFPESEVSGCVFHLMKAIQAHLKDIDHLEPAYQNNPNVRTWIRRFVELCMLP